jgi:hypothetical protein
VTVWVFIWLMVFLKIPIAALFLIVRWAVKQTPETEPGQDGGIGPRLRPLHPRHPRAPRPRPPRRGPHGQPSPAAPARVRAPRTRLVTARARLAQR